MYYYCSIIDQIKLLFKRKVLPARLYLNANENLINDIKDSTYYKEFIKTFDTDNGILTGLVNIDGINCCEKSNLSIWPVYIAINEIDIEDRFNIKNIILAGLSVGHAKPLINEFMAPIRKELINLAIGFDYDNKM